MPEEVITTLSAQPNLAQRAMDRLSGLVIAIAGAALLGLVVVQGWQVIARYVLNDSPSWTEPVTVLLLSTAMSLGAASGVHRQRHFGFYLLSDAVGPLGGHFLKALSSLVIVAIGGTLAYWGWILLLDGLQIRAAGANMPQSISYLPLAIAGVLMVVFALHQLVSRFTRAMPSGVR